MKITVIGGAGTIGSCIAFTLAYRGLADELILTDNNANSLQSHVMDISTSLAGYRNVVVKAGDEEALSGSDIVIVTATIPAAGDTPREELIRKNVPLIRTIAQAVEKYCPRATVIVVTNPIDSLTYAFSLCSRLNSKQIIGYNLNDSMRFQMAVASLFNASAAEIEGMVVGEHVYNLVMLFSSIRIAGREVEITQAIKDRLNDNVPAMLKAFIKVSTNRTAGWTTAAGIAAIVHAIKNDTGQVMPCSTVLAGHYGYKGISMGVPVSLGRSGVTDIVELALPADEKGQLDKAAASLEPAARLIEQLAAS